MKGLIYKDMCTLNQYKKGLVLQFVLLAVLAVIFKFDGSFMVTLMAIMGINIVATSFTHDESAKWDRYAATLPLTRGSVVNAKYGFALIITGMVAAMCFVLSLIMNLIAGRPMDPVLSLAMAGVGFVLVLLPSCINIPIAYRFGAEKARMSSTVVYLCFFFLILSPFLFFGVEAGDIDAMLANSGIVALIIVGAVVFVLALLFASWQLSRKFYEVKEL